MSSTDNDPEDPLEKPLTTIHNDADAPMSKRTAEAAFTAAMLGICDEVTRVSHDPFLLRESITRLGAVAAARHLLHHADTSSTFKRLAKQNHLQLAVESLIIGPLGRGLFTPEEIAAADWRLRHHRTRRTRKRTVNA